jgi:hypothetical protein
MFKKLFLASAMSLAVIGNAYAEIELNPTEQKQVDLLQAQIEFVTAAKDKEIAILNARIDFITNTARENERIRISHCKVPLLRIGCPPVGVTPWEPPTQTMTQAQFEAERQRQLRQQGYVTDPELLKKLNAPN